MYSIQILPPAGKDLDRFEKKLFTALKEKIQELRINPRPCGCEKLTAEEGYRIKIRDIRILYRVDDKAKTVFIYRVRHRREVYRKH
jgi:mRNA interferase RelE/StbE